MTSLPIDAVGAAVMRTFFSQHTQAMDKVVEQPQISGDPLIRTDQTLLYRILGNLVKNALEASKPGQPIGIEFVDDGTISFSVHNESVMPRSVQLQVFQRSFSTKSEHGRGIGTYSVKLLTERYLHGTVAFRSAEGQGTTFTVTLPTIKSTVPATIQDNLSRHRSLSIIDDLAWLHQRCFPRGQIHLQL